MKHVSILSVLLGVAAVATGAPELPKNGVLMEVWDNVKTGQVAELLTTIDKRPANAAYIKGKIDEGPSGADNFGTRFSAWLTAPETGEYTFFLAADDAAELLLSKDESEAGLQKVCSVGRYTPKHHFVPGRAAGTVRLEKGKKYALALHYKDAINDDHVALAWQGPGVAKDIVARKYLTPRLNEAQRKLWEETTRKTERGKELIKSMAAQPEGELSAWLDKLPRPDLLMLEDALTKVQSKLEGKGPEAFQKGMRRYVKIAAGIKATPETPVRNAVARKLLFMEDAWLKSLSQKQLLRLGAHRLADSLGKVPRGAKPVKRAMKLNSHGDKWREEYLSLGLYAIPGKPFTVTIPPAYVGKKLEVQVGHHFLQKNRPLVSMPNTTYWFKLDKETTQWVSPHGGILLLKVPKEVEMKDTPVGVEGALAAPQFVLGKHTDADWEKRKQAPGPWGELVSEHLILLVPRDVLQTVTKPTEVMTWWNENNRDLEDFYSYYPKVPFRMHSGHYAQEGVSVWPLHWEPKNMAYLLNMEAMREKNSALFLHEHGHHSDFWEMELSFWAESTTNWGGYYMKARPGKAFNWKDSHDRHLRRLFDPNDKGMQEIMQDKWYKIANKGTHHWSYPITSMMIAYAEDFGWECVKGTIKRLRDKDDAMYKWDFVQGADADQAKIDRYLIGLSEAAKRDVRPYFAHFKMFPSAGAAAYLDKLGLTKWDMTYLVQPEKLSTVKNVPLSLACGRNELLSFAKKSSIQWHPVSKMGGRVSMQGKDKAVYTPLDGFTGEDTIRYRVANEFGFVDKEMRIVVE